MEIKELKEVYTGFLEIQGLSARMTEIKEKLARFKERNEMSPRLLVEVSARILKLKGVMKKIIYSRMIKNLEKYIYSSSKPEVEELSKESSGSSFDAKKSKSEYVFPDVKVEAKHPSWVEVNDTGFESLSNLKVISSFDDSFSHLEMKFCNSFNTHGISFTSGSVDLGAFSSDSFWIEVSELRVDLGYVFDPGELFHN